MEGNRPYDLKNTIANWIEGHQNDLGSVTLKLSGISGSSLLFEANSRQLHMSVPCYVGLRDFNNFSEEVFVVTAADPDSDLRFNASLMALNEKLERLRPDLDTIHVAMEYLLTALKKYQVKDSQSSNPSIHDDDMNEEGDDNDDTADEVDFGYDMASHEYANICSSTFLDMASHEDANVCSSTFLEIRSKGFLYGMAADAKRQCESARQKISNPHETMDHARMNSERILAWCSVKADPNDLRVHIKMQIGGIVSDDVSAASLGLSTDFPMCISLELNKDCWSRQEYNLPLQVDACSVRATGLEQSKPDANEKDKQSMKGFDHRHRFGEEVVVPELVRCYFKFLKTQDRSTALSAEILEDLTAYASEKNVFVGLICFLAARLRALPNWCVVCWNTLPYNVGRLRTCDRELCLYRFEELGLGTTVLQEVQKFPEIIDFEISVAISAVESTRDVFEPFPGFLLEWRELRGRSGWFSKNVKTQGKTYISSYCADNFGKDVGNKKLSVLKSILYAFPSVGTMQSCTDEVELKKVLTELWEKAQRQKMVEEWKQKLWLPYDVLRFLLSTSRLTMYYLQGSEALSQFTDAIYQFAVLHDNPEKEAHFEKRRHEMGGSFFAFHGSTTGNWYSILRNGLRSLSNTSYMSKGAAYGTGIYTASDMSISLSYSGTSCGWNHGKLHQGFSVMAICEVVNGSTRSEAHSGIMVVPPECEQDILIRYILVLSGTNYSDSRGRSIISTNLKDSKNRRTDLLDHHRRLRHMYPAKQQSELAELRKVRWMSMVAMCKDEEDVEQRHQTSSHARPNGISHASSSMPGCIQAIQKEFKNIVNQINAAKKKKVANETNVPILAGIQIDMPDETDLRRWHVDLSQDIFKGGRLYEDLVHCARRNKKKSSSVKLECLFPDTFPMAPPFIRVMSPRFKFHTGHVTVGGSICMELLTESGWSPAFCFESVLVQIVSAMMEGGARLDSTSKSEYSEHEARAAFDRVARDHGWIKGKGAY